MRRRHRLVRSVAGRSLLHNLLHCFLINWFCQLWHQLSQKLAQFMVAIMAHIMSGIMPSMRRWDTRPYFVIMPEEGAKDINGNPVREDSPPVSASSSSASSSCAVDRPRRDCGPCFLSSFPSSLNQFGSDLTSKVSAASSHDMSSSDTHTNKSTATARKKKKKAKEDQEIKAEEIPGHKGNLALSDLLQFITGNPNNNNNKEIDKTVNSKSKKKKPQKNGPTITGTSGAKEDNKYNVGNNRSENKSSSAGPAGMGKHALRDSTTLSENSDKSVSSSVEQENQQIVLSSCVSLREPESDTNTSTPLPDLAKRFSSNTGDNYPVSAPKSLVASSRHADDTESNRHTPCSSPPANNSLQDTMSVLINGPPVRTTNHILVENELLPLLSETGNAKNKRKKLQKNAPGGSKEEGRNSEGQMCGYGSLDGDRRSSSGSDKNTPASSAASDSSQSEDVSSSTRDSSDTSPISNPVEDPDNAPTKAMEKSGSILRSPNNQSSAGARTSTIVGGKDKYIFTDFEVVPPPSEGEFTIVSTRRKKKHCPPVQPQRPSDRLRPQQYNRPPVNMMISTPILAAPSPVPRDNSSERAFSPSGFPVLGRGQEGRRNSTGTVPTTLLQDESDSESVKSLPAAGNPVPAKKDSYAKIVAGSKADDPAVSCNVQIQGVSEKNDASGDGLPGDNSPTWSDLPVLKGENNIDMSEYPPMCGADSCRPEELNISHKDNQPTDNTWVAEPPQTTANSKDSAVHSQTSVSIPTTGITNEDSSKALSSTTTSKISKQSTIITATSNLDGLSREKIPSTVLVNDVAVKSDSLIQAQRPRSRPNSGKQPAVSGTSLSAKENNTLIISKSNISSGTEVVNAKPFAATSQILSITRPTTTTTVVQKHPPKTKSAKTRQQSKSVIFLDRHFQEPSPALGITFGFEPGLDETNTNSQEVNEEADETSVTDLITPPQHTCSPDPPVNNNARSSPPCPADSTTFTASSHINAKAPSLPNGLVIPHPGAASTISGKSAPAPAFSPLATRLSMPPPKKLDANFQPGFFNQLESVNYVYTNWEDVQNRMKKEPRRVMVFSVE